MEGMKSEVPSDMDIKEHNSMICIAIVIFFSDLTFNGFAVNGQLLKRNEANSSPSKITAIKGSSVWLHWNYTYLGDGAHFGGALITNYIEQIIGFSSTSQPTIQALVKRTGQNGVLTLQSSIPAPFNGRVEVISSNSTLVIHDLQYNDSSCQFSSNVKINVDSGAGPNVHTFNLKPIVTNIVNGIPNFIRRPPSTYDVTEQSNIQLRIEMDGNPKPSAEFDWSYLPVSSPRNVPATPLYPFVYSSTYSLSNIDGSYCGRILQTTLKNSIGSSSVGETNVTVILTLHKPFDLKAGKLAKSKCVEVKWNKAESGACFVKYDVKLKDSAGNYLYNKVEYNIGEMRICNLRDFANITNVELVISFKNSSKTVTAKLSEAPVTTQTPSIPRTNYSSVSRENSTQTTLPVTTKAVECNNMLSDDWKTRDSAFLSVIVILVIIIIIMLIAILHLRGKPSSDTDEKPSSTDQQLEMHYMDLQVPSNETESNYAKLQGEYEEIGKKKNPYYVNV